METHVPSITNGNVARLNRVIGDVEKLDSQVNNPETGLPVTRTELRETRDDVRGLRWLLYVTIGLMISANGVGLAVLASLDK